MKKLFLLAITFTLFSSTYSYTGKDIDTAIYKLCREIMVLDPQGFSTINYTELAYLKRNYSLPMLLLNDTLYRNSKFNNYYYDQYYLYSKFLNENAVVTEDCFHIEESTEKGLPMFEKLKLYVIYPNSIKLPANIIELIEENATVDKFWGPYQMLTTIYYLKKYNFQNLSDTQKSKLAALESRLSQIIYTNYIENLPVSSYYLMGLKVLKMNKNELVRNIDISGMVDYFKQNKPLTFIEGDRMYLESLSRIGRKQLLEYDACALLWIFLLAK